MFNKLKIKKKNVSFACSAINTDETYELNKW